MREELVQSAVKFLQNPEISSAPLAKRIEFLESKDLTQPEIQEALSRCGTLVGDSSSGGSSEATTKATPKATTATPPTITTTTSAPFVPQYPSHPPPAPQRDWRDTFITATTTVGLAYGLYILARKYIIPTVLPPTPQALDADKRALEAEFAKVQATLDNIEKDTSAMKAADEIRSDEISRVLADVEASIAKLTTEAQKREEEMRLIKAEVGSVRETLPVSIEKIKQNQSIALEELMSEVKSLKQLLGSRAKIEKSTPATTLEATTPTSPTVGAATTPSSTTIPLDTPGSSVSTTPHPASMTGLPRAGIPAWQLAASAKKD